MRCDVCGQEVNERFLYLPRSLPRIGIHHSLASGSWVCALCLAKEYANLTFLYAKFYLGLGFSVIPVAYKDKKPLVAWEEFQRRKPTEEEVASWFAWERRNVGIVCGHVSSNLVVLDFDSPEAYTDFFAGHRELEKTTMVVATKKGRHVYLRSAEGVNSSRVPELRLEIRSDGNYVVAPPSIHPEPDEDGRDVQYRFVNPNVEKIALVDNVWQAVLKRATQLGVRLPSRRLVSLPRDAMKELSLLGRPYRGSTLPCILKLLGGVPEGQRNDTCIKIASYFSAFCGLTPSRVVNILLDWNERNLPPLPEREVHAVVESETKRGYRFGCGSFQDVCSPIDCPLLQQASGGAVMELAGTPIFGATSIEWPTRPTAKWNLTPLKIRERGEEG